MLGRHVVGRLVDEHLLVVVREDGGGPLGLSVRRHPDEDVPRRVGNLPNRPCVGASGVGLFVGVAAVRVGEFRRGDGVGPPVLLGELQSVRSLDDGSVLLLFEMSEAGYLCEGLQWLQRRAHQDAAAELAELLADGARWETVVQRKTGGVGPAPRLGGVGVVPRPFEFDFPEEVGVVGPIPRSERPAHRWRCAAFVLLFDRIENPAGDGTHRLGAGPHFRVEAVAFGPPRQLVRAGLFGVSERYLVVA